MCGLLRGGKISRNRAGEGRWGQAGAVVTLTKVVSVGLSEGVVSHQQSEGAKPAVL